MSTAASAAIRAYLTPIVEDRKAHPTGDLISDIVTAEIDGERLGDEHIYGFLRLLLPAGAETTFAAMGNCLLALVDRPEVLDRVRSDPSLLDTVVEETLRWETSVTMVNRETTCPVEIDGVEIPAGVSLVCATGSANRDEARYTDGDQWDLDRHEPPHIAFGTGRHQCLGMHLARMELPRRARRAAGSAPGTTPRPRRRRPGRGYGLPLAAAPAGGLRLCPARTRELTPPPRTYPDYSSSSPVTAATAATLWPSSRLMRRTPVASRP